MYQYSGIALISMEYGDSKLYVCFWCLVNGRNEMMFFYLFSGNHDRTGTKGIIPLVVFQSVTVHPHTVPFHYQ